MEKDELDRKLSEHKKWLDTNGKEGCRADFSGIDLTGVDFASKAPQVDESYQEQFLGPLDPLFDCLGPDLSGANLEGAELIGANLSRANLVGANLVGANLYGARLEHTFLRDADLRQADMRGASLHRAMLPAANLAGANLMHAEMFKVDAPGADLSGADLRWADLRFAHMSDAILIGAKLSGADLRGIWVPNASLDSEISAYPPKTKWALAVPQESGSVWFFHDVQKFETMRSVRQYFKGTPGAIKWLDQLQDRGLKDEQGRS